RPVSRSVKRLLVPHDCIGPTSLRSRVFILTTSAERTLNLNHHPVNQIGYASFYRHSSPVRQADTLQREVSCQPRIPNAVHIVHAHKLIPVLQQSLTRYDQQASSRPGARAHKGVGQGPETLVTHHTHDGRRRILGSRVCTLTGWYRVNHPRQKSPDGHHGTVSVALQVFDQLT